MKAEYNEKFMEAMKFAYQHHAHQTRKASGAPYVSHLLSVAALVIENGGSDEAAIAALLHDVVEDCDVSDWMVRERFDGRVADLVKAVTNPPVSWRGRPQPEIDAELRKFRTAYAKRISESEKDIQILSASDKLHNARCILADLQWVTVKNGTDRPTFHEKVRKLWRRFRGKKATETIWYYRMLSEAYRKSTHVAVRQLGISLAAVCGQLDNYNFDWEG